MKQTKILRLNKIDKVKLKDRKKSSDFGVQPLHFRLSFRLALRFEIHRTYSDFMHRCLFSDLVCCQNCFKNILYQRDCMDISARFGLPL